MYLSKTPDFELQFTRVVPSTLPPERLERHISAISRWPQWFYSLTEVQMLPPTSNLQKGSELLLKMKSRRGDAFDLTARVAEYDPARQIKLDIIQDSSGRLTHAFDQLEWTIELQSHSQGSQIRGSARAHTCHWRTRLFGRMAEKILMHQIFYPNLEKLSELRQPFSLEVPREVSPF